MLAAKRTYLTSGYSVFKVQKGNGAAVSGDAKSKRTEEKIPFTIHDIFWRFINGERRLFINCLQLETYRVIITIKMKKA